MPGLRHKSGLTCLSLHPTNRLENAKALRVVDPAFVLSVGGNPSSYSALLHESYGFSPDLKNLKELSVTAGWCRAVTDVQTKLRKKELMLSKPTLVLSTAADTVLDHADISKNGLFVDSVLSQPKGLPLRSISSPFTTTASS